MEADLLVKISPEELNALVAKKYADDGHPLPAGVSITVTIIKAGVSVPAPIPVHSDGIDPGSPFSNKCIATSFGYKDSGDSGKGAFKDRSTGEFYDTNNQTLVGASVPIPILWDTIGKKDYDAISDLKYTVSVISHETRKVMRKVRIVDLGPGESVNGQHGLIVGSDGVGHYLDQTYGLCMALGHKYNSSQMVTWWIEDEAGNPLEMRGLDAPKKVV